MICLKIILKYNFRKKCENVQILTCYTYVDNGRLRNNGNFPFLERPYSELQKSLHTYVCSFLSFGVFSTIFTWKNKEKQRKTKRTPWLLARKPFIFAVKRRNNTSPFWDDNSLKYYLEMENITITRLVNIMS